MAFDQQQEHPVDGATVSFVGARLVSTQRSALCVYRYTCYFSANIDIAFSCETLPLDNSGHKMIVITLVGMVNLNLHFRKIKHLIYIIQTSLLSMCEYHEYSVK